MARPRLWTSSAHALTVLVMLFQSMFFRRFSTSKGRERGLLSLKHPSDSNWTENDKKGKKKKRKWWQKNKKKKQKNRWRDTPISHLCSKPHKKSQSQRDIRYVICAIFVCEIPHLIWLLKGHLFFHHVFRSVSLTSVLYNPLLWYISLSQE